jgi:hypothetical protein
MQATKNSGQEAVWVGPDFNRSRRLARMYGM